MCKKRVLIIVVLLAVSWTGFNLAYGNEKKEDSDARPSVLQRVARNWERNDVIIIRSEVPARPNQPGVDPRYSAARTDERKVAALPSISFCIQPNGQVFDSQILRSSGIAAVDLSCLDAILGCAPFEGLKLQTPLSVQCDFALLNSDVKLDKKQSADDYSCHNLSKSFAIAAPSNEPVFYFHSIPADAARRFSGVITKDEIHSSENSRCLRIGSAAPQLKTIRNAWEQFFANHPQATKQELFKQREQLDQEFRTWFDDAERQSAAAGWGG